MTRATCARSPTDPLGGFRKRRILGAWRHSLPRCRLCGPVDFRTHGARLSLSFREIVQVPALKVIPGVGGWLLLREIQQHYIRALPHSFKYDFTTVRGDVEVADIEVGSNIRQLPLGTGRQFADP